MSDPKQLNALRRFVFERWRADVANGQEPDIQAAVNAVASDPSMAHLAVIWAVRDIGRLVDRELRRSMLTDSAAAAETPRQPRANELVIALIEHGRTLLDMKLGSKSLGDCLPAEAEEYAGRLKTSAHTTLLRASFVLAAARLCSDPHRPIREQVSVGQLETLREQVFGRAA